MAYDRAQFIQQHRDMVAQWADYLDKPRVNANLIPLRA
jgi:hypothetical protein